MFKTPFTTTVCKDYRVERIREEILKENISGVLGEQVETNPLTGEDVKDTYVQLIDGRATAIPTFAHPLDINNDSSKDQKNNAHEDEYGEMTWFALDVRNFTRLDRNENMVISSQHDYKLHVIRALLSDYWLRNPTEDMIALGNIQLRVFARWLTEVITRRLALEPDTQMRVTAIAAFYYLCLFYEEIDLDKKLTRRMARRIQEVLRLPSETIDEVMEEVGYMANAEDFVNALRNYGYSTRLEQMNLALLYTVVGGSWFGANSREVLAVSLEHPPTFISLLAMAFTQRGYRKTILGKATELATKKNEDKDFVTNLQKLPI